MYDGDASLVGAILKANDHGEVSELSMTWDDYFMDMGQGIAASEYIANRTASAIARLYGFSDAEKLSKIFSRTVENRIFENDFFILNISVEMGPAIITRNLTIRSK
jgi:hypothetical protein